MRLDLYLVKKGLCKSRDRAKALIKDGKCLVNGKVVVKGSAKISDDDRVKLKEPDFPYVSRGGLKLEAALEEFEIDVNGFTVIDVGVATGGFTDCLLRFGAKKVFAVDVGKGQLDESLLKNERVVFINNRDIRAVRDMDFNEDIDLIVVDVSFISVTAILESLKKIVQNHGAKGGVSFIFLVKPQYEFGRKHSGVIKDPVIIDEILDRVRGDFSAKGFNVLAETPSPILGKEGNREFLWHVEMN